MITEILWWVFASMAIGGALGTITRKNPIGSLLFLIITFFALAAIYVMLGAQFIGAVQIIVYAGAIMVLFLFVIMLLNLGHDYRSDMRGGFWIGGLLARASIGWALVADFRGRQLWGADQMAAASRRSMPQVERPERRGGDRIPAVPRLRRAVRDHLAAAARRHRSAQSCSPRRGCEHGQPFTRAVCDRSCS